MYEIVRTTPYDSKRLRSKEWMELAVVDMGRLSEYANQIFGVINEICRGLYPQQIPFIDILCAATPERSKCCRV